MSDLMLHTMVLRGRGGPVKHMMGLTGVEIYRACLSAEL